MTSVLPIESWRWVVRALGAMLLAAATLAAQAPQVGLIGPLPAAAPASTFDVTEKTIFTWRHCQSEHVAGSPLQLARRPRSIPDEKTGRHDVRVDAVGREVLVIRQVVAFEEQIQPAIYAERNHLRDARIQGHVRIQLQQAGRNRRQPAGRSEAVDDLERPGSNRSPPMMRSSPSTIR